MAQELEKNLLINGRYQLLEYIGSGSFGEVWRAYDKTDKENVAIKVYISLDKHGQEEFMDEYKIASGLRHHNLLVTKNYDLWESRPFLTMKYCPNGSAVSLVGKLKPSKEDEFILWNFIHDVVAGLAYLHNIEPDPIVHQDIKPDNVLRDSDGSFLITDFGISKRVRSTLRQQSSRAQKAGAVAYMGPERFSNKPTPILASDIWSLGASIYEMAEGELPFAGQGGVMLKNGADMAELSAGWSSRLNTIMQRCLAKEPWNRIKAHELEEEATVVLSNFDNFYAHATFLNASTTEFDPRKTIRQTHSNPSDQKVESDSPNNVPPQNTEPPTSKNKLLWGWFVGIPAAIVVFGICIHLLFYTNNESDGLVIAKQNLVEYNETVSNCSSKIDQGNAANRTILLEAKKLLEKVMQFENKHANALPNDYDKSHSLEQRLTPKLKEAAHEWAVAAKAQAEDLDDYETAAEYYQLALELYRDANILREYNRCVKRIHSEQNNN